MPLSSIRSSNDKIPPALTEARPRVALRRLRTNTRARLMGVGPIVRRSIDIAVTATALLLLAPLFLVVAALIKAQDGGAALFTQERVGKHGRRFRLFKLRTMVRDAEALKAALAVARPEGSSGVRFKLERDPRITPLGRILRKFSIDELPQLYNVLVGDMTLVGPRPPIWAEVVRYTPRQLRRLQVTPGLTCLWQVGGRSDLSFEQQVELDIEYIDRVTVRQEIAIALRTVPAVLSGRGAY
jgi:lipopolysaccharide/colanic/teichoic acid biosynthesis glycosyltransferase